MKKYKKKTLLANKDILSNRLVYLTWGNVSLRSGKKVYIKPSGVDLKTISWKDISELDLSGKRISGLKESVDTPAHLELFSNWPEINCIIHTHSMYATSFAQANMSIPCLGTTHADYFRGEIPIVPIPKWKNEESYEKSTGKSIVDFFKNKKLSYLDIPSVLVANHGVFSWGKNMKKALENAFVLEKIAELSFITMSLNKDFIELDKSILEKHFLRKNGVNKYYGQ